MDTVERYMEEVIHEHHVILDAKDPVLVLLTILRKYEADLAKCQKEHFTHFVSLLEEEHDKQDEEFKKKAERILSLVFKNQEEVCLRLESRLKQFETSIDSRKTPDSPRETSIETSCEIPRMIWMLLAGNLFFTICVFFLLCLA